MPCVLVGFEKLAEGLYLLELKKDTNEKELASKW